ncbi:hypothetical protein [uncultured Psychroserpens sp.]|uniref:hypothetical protein n=1 Tax=uncultured Psychroserpens sp. TaxID=255436 RepID=UPI002631D0C9|nr:hypothetical protein [uncultured Psychroserpens sp.]
MKQLLTILCLATLMIACKSETKDQNTISETISEEKKELTTPEKIAKAHGFDSWKDVNTIEFTFNVDRGDNHFERSWSWEPKENRISFSNSKDSIITFKRSQVDPINLDYDQAFINDKYWLLVPFQLIWDEGITISDAVKEKAPISNSELNKITLTYGNEGGYTPGDAYDIYFDNDHIIREWIYRKGNSKEPSMTTTFENYEDFNGLKIAKDHKTAEGNFNLYFSNIKVN